MSGASFPDREARARRLLRTLSEHARVQEPTTGDPSAPVDATRPLDSTALFSRYEVRERIGEGATAVVYKAWDRELKRLVALKVLKESKGLLEVARQRFRRESQVAAGLSHPNIVPVYDVGEDNGRLFIVMELVEGRTMGDLLHGAPPPDAPRLALLERVARGVAAAHAQGIVHRDLKPGNILVTAAGEPKVADFGLAHLEGTSAQLTRTGSTLGTPLYMAPEQVRGRSHEISPRTDVYALGAMLYELVAGHPPFSGETLLELYEKILNDEPAPLRRFRPDAPADLDTIARKALAKEPGFRYPSAAEFAEDLRRHAAGEPISARPETFMEKLRRKASRRRGALLLLLAATAAGVVLAVSWWRMTSPAATVEEAAGEVLLVSDAGNATVAKGYALRPGQILRTGASGRATLQDAAGARLVLGAGTMVQALTGDRAGYFVSLGTAEGRADASAQPLSLRTSHAEADVASGSVRVDVFPTATWIEVLQGTAQVRSLSDGKTADVAAGLFISVGAGREFAARPAAEGLLGYWPFEDDSQNVARDASGRGNDGIFLHRPLVTEGKKGKGVGLDGTNFIEMPGLSGAKFPVSGTLAFWVKGDFKSQKFTDLFDRYDRDRPHLFIRGILKPAGLQVVFQEDGYRFERVSPIPEQEWTHLAVTWDTTAKKAALYLNGSLSFAAPIEDPPWTPSGQFFRIGGMGYSETAFRGVVDEVRLYGTPLSPEAIRDLHGR
ncbi:MAG: protein kinase [Planctomycetaceae bacterium]|nr:protein kinase [Planctomycetaceae bacterium]